MKILSIDSSNRNNSVSLYDSSSSRILGTLVQESQSSTLMPMINKVFLDSSLQPHDLGLLLCNLGPGSFTALRTAVIITKTIAQQLGLKIFPVNNFQLIRFENTLSDNVPLAIAAGTSGFFVSRSTSWNNPEENFYSQEALETLYELKENNLSKLMLEFFLSLESPSLLDYSGIQPYYLREPSIGLGKQS